MDYHNELYGALKQHKTQDALCIAGTLIHMKAFDLLVKTWLRAFACICQYTSVCFVKLYDTATMLVEIIEDENINVATAFTLTTKLCILFKNAVQYVAIQATKIAELREKTINYFLDGHCPDGIFDTILPKPVNERSFCAKILCSLVELWRSKNVVGYRDTLEYLCRRDYIIESLHSETGNNTIVSFLWDFMRVYQPQITTPFYVLYKSGFKKKDKTWRNNFLYALHNYLHDEYGNVNWTTDERRIIEHTCAIAKDIWAFVLESNKTESATMAIEDKSTSVETEDSCAIFERFYPVRVLDVEPEPDIEHSPVDVRRISLKTAKSKRERKDKIEKRKPKTEKDDENFYNWESG